MIVWDLCFKPSIRVKSCETILLSTSPWVFSLLGAMESNSSMKMMAGAFFSASSKAFLKLDSDSPANLDMISGPLIRKKKAPVSLAREKLQKKILIGYYSIRYWLIFGTPDFNGPDEFVKKIVFPRCFLQGVVFYIFFGCDFSRFNKNL